MNIPTIPAGLAEWVSTRVGDMMPASTTLLCDVYLIEEVALA